MAEESPIDNLVFDDLANEEHSEEYVITKDMRNYMIIACLLIVLEIFRSGVGHHLSEFETVFSGIKEYIITIIAVIANSYFYYFLIQCFSHYQFDRLKQITLILFVLDIISRVQHWIDYILYNFLFLEIPKHVYSLLMVAIFVIIIIWCISIIKLDYLRYKKLEQLKKYGLSTLVISATAVVFSLSIGIFFSNLFVEEAWLFTLFGLITIIPYYYMIRFVLALNNQ